MNIHCMTNKNVSLYSFVIMNFFLHFEWYQGTEKHLKSVFLCTLKKMLDPRYFKFNGKQKVGLPISVTLHVSPSY